MNPNLITLTRDIENWLTQRYENYQKKHVEQHGTMRSNLSRSGHLFDNATSDALRSSGIGMQHFAASPVKSNHPHFAGQSPYSSNAPASPAPTTPTPSRFFSSILQSSSDRNSPFARDATAPGTPASQSGSRTPLAPQQAQQPNAQPKPMSEEEEMILDPLVLYLYALVLKEQGRPQEAKQFYLESLHRFPYNWSAWVDLASIITTKEELDLITTFLPNHWISDCFRAYASVEIQANVAALRLWQVPSFMFPNSNWLKAQVAKAFYNLRRFSRAQVRVFCFCSTFILRAQIGLPLLLALVCHHSIFSQHLHFVIKALLQELRDKDPHRFEEVDILSNIYYVMDDNIRLSALVNACTKSERFRPEIYTAIGNYYSMKREHELATIALRKAFRLDPKYTSAWTLIGHEYIEMKNTAAATESYRRAIDYNPNDARAWYGLGQTYEILGIPLYAIYPYQKATSLRPQDPRIWSALGSCYYVLGQKSESLSCFQRALALQEADRQGNDVLANVALAVEAQALSQAEEMRSSNDPASAKPYETIAQFASAAAATATTAAEIAVSAAAAETGDIAFKLAQLYAQFGDMKQAAIQYANHVGLGENWIHFTHNTPLPTRPQQSLSTVNESLLFLAEVALHDGNHGLAHALASRLLASGAGIAPDAAGAPGAAVGQRPLADLLRAREILASVEESVDAEFLQSGIDVDNIKETAQQRVRKHGEKDSLFYSDRDLGPNSYGHAEDMGLFGDSMHAEPIRSNGVGGDVRTHSEPGHGGHSAGRTGAEGLAMRSPVAAHGNLGWNISEIAGYSDDSNMDVSVASRSPHS